MLLTCLVEHGDESKLFVYRYVNPMVFEGNC